MNAAHALSLQQAYLLVAEDALKDKSYRAFPVGQEIGSYLRSKRKRLTEASYRDYESVLEKLARYFAWADDLLVFEPPVGRERLEEFMDHQWGDASGRTYNKALSVFSDFFKWSIMSGKLRGNPTLGIERARKAPVHRTTFRDDDVAGILAAQTELRDRVALRLLLDYGLRKGALRRVRFKDFDHQRQTLTIFTKGEKILVVPIPSSAFWLDLERHILDWQAEPDDYLLPRRKWVPHSKDPSTATIVEFRVGGQRGPQGMGDHGMHNWWYGCLERAGVVAPGVTSGERMHKARHTAGQRLLNATGNLKAAQKLLGHASIKTTADVYLDWDLDQLRASLRLVVDNEESDD